MPDLVTHMAFSHLMIRGFELTKNRPRFGSFRTLFYMGTILPDLLTRPWYILFTDTHDWTVAMHTPVGAVLVCAILSLLFEASLQKPAFLFLTGGAMSHFLLDAFQKQLIYNNYWFFPLSWKAVGWGIAGAGTIVEWIPVWLGIVLIFEVSVWTIQKIKNRERLSAG